MLLTLHLFATMTSDTHPFISVEVYANCGARISSHLVQRTLILLLQENVNRYYECYTVSDRRARLLQFQLLRYHKTNSLGFLKCFFFFFSPVKADIQQERSSSTKINSRITGIEVATTLIPPTYLLSLVSKL